MRLAGSFAPAPLGLPAMLSLRLGEAASEFTDVASGDQIACGRVAGWRQCPVLAGCPAAPDPPPRVPAPELVELRILVVPAGTAGKGAGWRAVAPRAAGG